MLYESWLTLTSSGLQFKYAANVKILNIFDYQHFLFCVSFVFPLQEALTPQKCIHHIIVRGLVRIRCVQEMERILYFMTRKGLINTGILSVSPDQYLLPKEYHNVSSCKNPCVINAIKVHGILFFFFLFLFPHYLSFKSELHLKANILHVFHMVLPHLPSMLTEITDTGVCQQGLYSRRHLWSPVLWICAF